jgi:exosortase/archaeosortase family protein
LIWFFTGNSVRIIWGCTGIKQSFIFFFILLFSQGPWKHKIWFIPLGLFASYVFNLFRISIITISMENHPLWFHFLHEYLFKFLYYGFIFGIWLIWEEKFNHKKDIEKA